MDRLTGKQIANAIANKDYLEVSSLIRVELSKDDIGVHWDRDLTKLLAFINDGEPRFSIFAKDGNGKLPFLAFSSAPGKGFCIGAGDCLNWCYSFRAWRYPAAFCRQMQNAIMLQTESGRERILAALDKFKPKTGQVDFRLYVDGDFTGDSDVSFWFNALNDRPWLSAYGYSKSWETLIDYSGLVPNNYRLNLSSGSKYSDSVKDKLKTRSFVRGEFKAVNIGRKVKSSDHGNREHQAELRRAYGQKAFTCPGLCGSCTKSGHACGSARFKDVDIIIAVH